MTMRDEAESYLETARSRLQGAEADPELERTGRVEEIGDGVAIISGLPHTRLDELIRFEDGTLGLALTVSETTHGCVLLAAGSGISAGSKVTGTGTVARVPVGEGLLGRVVSGIGEPMDGGPAIQAEREDPIERPAPGIVDRDLVTEPLLTGVTVIDAMIPLGRGQRQLIVGDRKTGKTTVAIDTIINQRDSDVICVYAAIGQKASTVNRVIEAVKAHGNMDRCVFVVGNADASPGAQWITPYAACTIAEYFRDKGQHALLILDDLSKHAIVYRQLSLLLHKPPGREAYPGDVFYLHARLLERAAKMSAENGGGSLTALPVAETLAGNLTAYIPTNLISITDGQIYLEPKLFYEGQKPAVNVGMSVSRVGGATQAKAIKSLADSLKLDYAQFLELEVFTRFGAMVDARTQKKIDHGRRLRAILGQNEYAPLPLSRQVALLLAVSEGKLDDLPLSEMARFRARIAERLPRDRPRAAAAIDETGQLTDECRAALRELIDLCLAEIAPPSADGTAETGARTGTATGQGA
ncbi:F0F1 ATP synthase subunit alpha [Pseudodonghicola flavimaris]|uniref:ATP synthase subunit alpha n=1 Tax=Pseudodonghicola flavimaris TaxID=3050036 RepID=A0ABT7F5Q2_9RHOB|nr:F0F1 ATP synthase subunit alpha [Pseudodonghicola flavimaris]MDK3019945.1 F0F1 ATP synthase subunit alpha [Pseudodonghicola flavimaris]